MQSLRVVLGLHRNYLLALFYHACSSPAFDVQGAYDVVASINFPSPLNPNDLLEELE